MLQNYTWCFWCYLVLLLLHSLGSNLKQFGLEGCLLLQSRSKVYIFVVMSNRIQFSSQNCTFQDSKTNAFGCCPGRLCDKGCQRPAFAAYATCCTYCQGPEGPHVSHPWFADQMGFRVDSFFVLKDLKESSGFPFWMADPDQSRQPKPRRVTVRRRSSWWATEEPMSQLQHSPHRLWSEPFAQSSIEALTSSLSKELWALVWHFDNRHCGSWFFGCSE